jgi:hypothetical protein
LRVVERCMLEHIIVVLSGIAWHGTCLHKDYVTHFTQLHTAQATSSVLTCSSSTSHHGSSRTPTSWRASAAGLTGSLSSMVRVAAQFVVAAVQLQ